MKKTKKIISLLLSITMIGTILTGCGENVVQRVQEQGTIQSVELEQAEVEDEVLPTYDINSIEQSTIYLDFEEKDPYYKSQLDSRNLIAYNEIRAAYLDYKTEVLLSKTITEDELFQIMSIMYIDDPMMFNMKTQYDYYLDTNGYIYKVNLYYDVNEISYRSYCERINNKLLGYYSTVLEGTNENHEVTEYDALTKLLESAFKSISLNMTGGGYQSIVAAIDNKQGYTPQSISKYFTLICRYLGIDCATVIGEYTNLEYKNALTPSTIYDIKSYNDVRNKYTTKTDEDGTIKYTVKYNYDNFAAWNIIKINDSWYHLDIATSSYISKSDPNVLNETDHNKFLYFVDDSTISMSRLFYFSEDLLGSIPLCTSKQFQDSYRKGNYLLTHSEEQMLTYLTNNIEIYPSRGTKSVLVQFEDETTYNYYLKHLSTVIDAYNNNSLNKYVSYDVKEIRGALVIYLYNLKYKN